MTVRLIALAVLLAMAAFLAAAIYQARADLWRWVIVFPRWLFVLLFIGFMVLLATGVIPALPEDWQGESDLERP